MGKGGSVSVKEESAMSQAAPVNSGAVAWRDLASARAAVARMQTKLHRWAGDDASRRFGDLFNLVYSPAFLVVAWQRVSSSKGARTAGVDGLTVAQVVTGAGVEAFLDQIRTAVRSGRFEPAPVRQVKIPKAGGKFRTLGISTVADRVVQASLKLVLEPIVEADFQPCSYGFRPNRRTHDAIAEIQMLATHGYHWVVEADVRACFDELGHTPILDRLRHRIKDKRVVALVRAFLKTGVMTTLGDREGTPTGTPQGAILSPLLANIALPALDDHFMTRWRQDMGTQVQRAKRRRHGVANYKLIRFADDFVVIVHGERQHAVALRGQLGFDFLGIRIRRQRKRGTEKSYVYTKPSKKSIKEIKRKVSVATYRSTRHQPVEEMIDEVGQVLRGWANYRVSRGHARSDRRAVGSMT